MYIFILSLYIYIHKRKDVNLDAACGSFVFQNCPYFYVVYMLLKHTKMSLNMWLEGTQTLLSFADLPLCWNNFDYLVQLVCKVSSFLCFSIFSSPVNDIQSKRIL